MDNSSVSNSWKILLFNGIIAILYALLVFFATEKTILTIVTFIGIFVLIIALAMLYAVYLNYKSKIPYGNDLFQAIIVLALGILLTFYSRGSIKVFVIIVGSWSLLLGFSQLFYAFKLPKIINSKTTMIINSILTIILGIILLLNPFTAANVMVVISGIIALLVGIILVVLSFKIKNVEAD